MLLKSSTRNPFKKRVAFLTSALQWRRGFPDFGLHENLFLMISCLFFLRTLQMILMRQRRGPSHIQGSWAQSDS